MALEALLAAPAAAEDSGAAGGSLGAHREAIAAAANAALRNELPGDSAAALEEAVARDGARPGSDARLGR